MNTKVSVIIPTYNRPALLKKCIDALAVQNFSKDNYEVIVVSDGPDQQTSDILNARLRNRADLQIRHLSLPYKKGPAAARNHGWLNARGDLIIFTDDDCLPDKNWIRSFFKLYIPGEKKVFTGKTIVPVSNRPTDHELNTHYLEDAEFITANCCCPKFLLKAVKGFDERFTMAWREDSDLEFKLLQAGVNISKAENAIVVHPVRDAPWGISIKEQKKTLFNALLYKKYPAIYREKIRAKAPLNYYMMIAAFAAMIAGSLLKLPVFALTGFVIWCGFTSHFIVKRLTATSLSLKHVLEMIVTSAVIPFSSVYWQFYGAFKYRVLFI